MHPGVGGYLLGVIAKRAHATTVAEEVPCTQDDNTHAKSPPLGMPSQTLNGPLKPV